MLLKYGTIAYRTADMSGLFSVAQTPQTSAFSQVMIRPDSDPPRVERADGEGIPHAVETRHNIRRRKTCADCSLPLRRLRPLPSSRCLSQLPNSPSIPSTQMKLMGKTGTMMDITTEKRKGTSWSSRLEKRKKS